MLCLVEPTVYTTDLPFFCNVSFPEIQTRTQDITMDYAVVSDMITQCGNKVKELLEDSNNMYYKPLDDTVNSNGRSSIQVCKDNDLLVVNNLHTAFFSFPGSQT